MTNPLDGIMEWYRTARDAMRVTARVLSKSTSGLITDRHVFFSLSVTASKERLKDAQNELDNLVVLGLVAVFERVLRNHVCEKVREALDSGDALSAAVCAELHQDVEFWNVSDRLLAVFSEVPDVLRGEVKQLIDFRNWVAHGHTLATAPPLNAVPNMAYQRLSEFLKKVAAIV